MARTDPVGLCVIEAMARRAGGLQGAARAWLLQRIELRLAAIKPAPAALVAPAERAADGSQARLLPACTLRLLVERLDRTGVAGDGAAGVASGAAFGAASGVAPSPRPLNALTAHKATWSRLRAEQRLRQALAQVPSMAGPLNSSQVVHRALQGLHEASPAYLDAFMAHIDTLLWLEQASGGDVPLKTPAGPRGGVRR